MVIEPRYYILIQDQFLRTKVVYYHRLQPQLLVEIDVLCINGKCKLKKISSAFCNYILFDFTYCTRKGWCNWYFNSLVITHSQVGGATLFCRTITVGIFHFQHKNFLIPTPYYLPAPRMHLCDFLSCTNMGAPSGKPPKVPLQDSTIWLGKNIIHANGLYPFDNTTVEVIAPLVFSSTKWSKRQITHGELTSLLDLPTLVPKLPKAWITTLPILVKILQSFVNKLFLFPGIEAGGVCFLWLCILLLQRNHHHQVLTRPSLQIGWKTSITRRKNQLPSMMTP